MNIFLEKMMVTALSVLVAWGAVLIPSRAAAFTPVPTGNVGGRAGANGYGVVASSNAVLTVETPGGPDSFDPGVDGHVYCMAVQADGKILVGGWFTTLGGQSRSNIGRLNADGTLDTGFNPGADYTVSSLAVQADGKILVGGYLKTLGGQNCFHIGRLNIDGTLDTGFNPGAGDTVYSLAMQADGKILVGGWFTTLGGQSRFHIGRLNADGTVDMVFDPGVSFYANSLAVQADGKILVGGYFSTLGGQSRSHIGRLNADGTVDMDFNPGANGEVRSLAVQADGKILVGGRFTTLGGQSRSHVGRLNADGTVDMDFNPGANDDLYSLAVQADGKILAGGNFTTLGGQSRAYMGRLNADGTLDSGFTSDASYSVYSYSVYSLAVQTDGRILVGGDFTTLGGQSRANIGRLTPTEPATQTLTFDGSTITWLRGGSSPEVWRTFFEGATSSNNWVPLGAGRRIAGGWQLTGVMPTNAMLRARGFVAGGNSYGSGWFVETIIAATNYAPVITTSPTNQTVTVGGTATLSVTAAGASPLSYQWNFNGTNIVGATNSMLTLTNVQGRQAGNYAVRVTNPYGSTLSLNAVLTLAANASKPSVLVIWDAINTNTLALKAALEAAGITVTLSPTDESQYIGLNPDPYAFDAVIMMIGANYEMDMPTTGQNTLVGYVRDGGGFLHGGMEGAELYSGRLANWRELILYDYESGGQGTITMNNVPAQSAHPVLANIPASFNFETYLFLGAAHVFATNPVTVLMRDNWGDDAVAVRQLGAGRIVGFHHRANGILSLNPLLEANVQQLYINGVRWAGMPVTTNGLVIVRQPQSLTTEAGLDAVFAVAARGMAPVGYQWKFKGTNLAGATNSFLTLTNVQLTQAGDYTVLVTNTYGSVTSSSAMLTVAPASTGLITFDDISADCGPVAIPTPYFGLTWNNFSCLNAVYSSGGYPVGMISPSYVCYNAYGYPASLSSSTPFTLGAAYLTAAWVPGLQLTVKGYSNGRLAYDQTFTLSTTNPALIHFNYIGVTLVEFSTSVNSPFVMDNVSLSATSGSAPVISTQPVNLTLPVGSNALFSVVATGTAPLYYQWRFDGTNLIGATNVSLTLTNVSLAQGGNYSVQVTNLFGSVTSSNAVLTVENPSVLDAFNYGANGYITCTAVQADGKILVGGSFTTLGGQSRSNIGRLNADGTLDAKFNPEADNGVRSLAVQADGKILVSGEFTTLGGQSRFYIGRLNADGTLDTGFNPGASYFVNSLAVQADGKILVGGNFPMLGGQSRKHIGRLNADGTLDTGFNPGANGDVISLAVQADGKIVVGGGFSTLGDQSRFYIGRLNADGTLDTGFNPGVDFYVFSLAVQADGKILVGGWFYGLGGQDRSNIGRLNADGTLDTGFNPGANGDVRSLGLQADGKILVSGEFTTLGGQSRSYIGRLNADGTVDTGFNPGANDDVSSLAMQADGKILVGGNFSMLGGQSRSHIGRLTPTEPATQSLTFDGSTITWLRGGCSPEVWRTSFEGETSSNNWVSLGAGTRIAGGWQLTGVRPTNTMLRARGFVVGGNGNNSGWFVETIIKSPDLSPMVMGQPTNVAVALGGTATFSVTASGAQPISYQWRFNGTNISDATNSSLSLLNVQPGLAGNYSVILSNFVGMAVSSNAVLDILTPPTVLAQTPSQVVQLGELATFNVRVTGSTPLRYFWSRNGGLIPDATNASYSFTAQLTDSGSRFSCLVTNAYGSACSTNATLKVIDTIANDLWSGAIVISNGMYTNVQSTLKAGSFGDPVPGCVDGFGHGVWYQFTAPVAGLLVVDTFGSDFDTGLAIYTGAGGAWTELDCNDDFDGVTSQISLPITAGTTYFILAGGYGSDAGNLVLHLSHLLPPVFVAQPESQSVGVGNDVRFGTTLTGTLPMSFQWRFNGTNLPGATGATLTLTNVQPGQAGEYSVIVSNLAGVAGSSNSVLTVVTLPTNIVFSADFESGNDGFIYVADPNASSNLWHRTTHRFASASHCQYYGLEDNWNYNTANLRNAGMLQSPTVSLANVAGPITLSFNYLLQTEALTNWDQAQVQISADNGSTWVALASRGFTNGLTSSTTNTSFVNWAGDISAYAGSNVVLRFGFDTMDGRVNQFEGWYLDDVTIKTAGSLAQGVAVYDNPLFVDTTGWDGAESDNVQASLTNLGFSVVTFTNLIGGVAGQSVVLIPELENGDLAASLTGFERTAMKNFVQSGGTLVVHGAYNTTRTASLINSILGTAITESTEAIGVVYSRTTQAGGTSFADNPITLAAMDGSDYLAMASLPPGAFSIYTNGTRSLVAVLPSGAGRIIFLGWDWYDAVPIGSQNGGWLQVLASAVSYGEGQIQQPPTITQQPTNQIAKVGGTAAFSVTVQGAWPLTYQWLFNGANLPGETNAALNLANIQLAEAGNYAVLVTNLYGAVASANARLTVTGPDLIPNGVDWPTFGNGPSHTGYYPGSLGRAVLAPAWSTNFGWALNQVAVGAGKVYVTPFLTVLGATNGQLAWQTNFPNVFSINPPTYDHGRVYVQLGRGYDGRDAQLTSFDTSNGALLWSTALNTQWERYYAPTVYGDGIWVEGGIFGGLYGLSTNGAQRFFNGGLAQVDQWTPTYYQGVIYSWVESTFRAHDPVTGVVQWSANFGWDWNRSPMCTVSAIDDGIAFVQQRTNLIAIDLATHTNLWKVAGAMTGSPAVAKGVVYAIFGNQVKAFAAQTGDNTANYLTASGTTLAGQPIVADDALLVASSGATYVFDLASQQLIQTIPHGGTLAIANGYLYIAGLDGGLYAYFAANFAPSTLAAPAILSQPSSQTVLGGTNVLFQVAAIGNPQLTYRWWQNGTNPVGGNSSMLVLTNVCRAHSGTYAVSITNSIGGVFSTNAWLKVMVPQVLGVPKLLPDGTFRLTSTDADGGVISPADLTNLEVQYSTNLVNWDRLTDALSLTNGTLQLHDSGRTNNLSRFYRIIEH